MPFAFHAPCHQRTLRSMESTDSSAGNGDEQTGEDCAHLGIHVVKSVGEFGQTWPFDEQHNHQRDGHEQHRDGEYGVDASDDFVDWQHGGEKIVAEDYHAPDVYPCERVAAQLAQNQRGTVYEHCPNHQQKEHREDQHHLLCALAEIQSYYLRQARAAVAH